MLCSSSVGFLWGCHRCGVVLQDWSHLGNELKQCFMGTGCCGIIVVQFDMESGRGSYFFSIVQRLNADACLFLLLFVDRHLVRRTSL